MTADTPPPKDFTARVGELVGGFVRNAEIGHGSMVTIDVEHVGAANRVDHVWICLANWALHHGDTECLAADMPVAAFAEARDAISELVGQMIRKVRLPAPDEVHIKFSGQLRLEIWADPEAYGRDQNVMMLFAQGKHVSTLTG